MFEKFAEQFNNDVIARYQQKLAVLAKTAEGMTIEDLKGLTRTIGEAMIPQSMKDLGTILENSGNSPVNTATNTLTKATFMDEEGKPWFYTMDDNIHEPVAFNGGPDTFENSRYY